jgi:hypothetical protein
MTASPRPNVCRSCGPSFGASVGRVVARIDGALGSAILIGMDRVAICRCTYAAHDQSIRSPWSYGDLDGADLHHYGTMPVVVLHLVDRPDPMPLLVLERDQLTSALDGLITLRRLIALAGRTAADEPPAPASPRPRRAGLIR